MDVNNLSNHVNLVFLFLTFSLNLYFSLLIAALSTTVKKEANDAVNWMTTHTRKGMCKSVLATITIFVGWDFRQRCVVCSLSGFGNGQNKYVRC